MQILQDLAGNLRISLVLTHNLQNSPVMTANMRTSPVMTANMQISQVIKDRYMIHVTYRTPQILENSFPENVSFSFLWKGQNYLTQLFPLFGVQDIIVNEK